MNGEMDLQSLVKTYTVTEWKQEYPQVIQARIVFIDKEKRVVRLSSRQHIMKLQFQMQLPAIG